MARRATPARTRPAAATGALAADSAAGGAAVGPRQACPCGSGRRYKACHGAKTRPAPVLRPFAGRVDEPDLVALRELVPSATAPVALHPDHLIKHPEHADRTIILGTMLPQAAPALVRDTGEILLAAQTLVPGLDPSADIAGALLAALAAKPGSVVTDGPASALATVERLPEGLAGLPRLVDLLAPAPLAVSVHQGFDWWLPPAEEGQALSSEVTMSLERANASVVPTARLRSVEAAYWTRPGDKVHLRWVLPYPAGTDAESRAGAEEELLDALARLAAAGRLTMGEGSRFAGSFRADGLVVPVWDLAADADADSCEEPAAALRAALDEVLAERRPLTADERRARAGVVGRTLTLR
ncbi:SEC-C domain-containing protein [Frankia sp. CNm7]|uniref:SEC-C domain-containing protein n=1 Tax=Frankia nepalensis TaxID=1836974 RepID=A0A937UQC6_9ACTN|nr:SEC-C domain-containing protein [Frankia nepalensis]MBL7514770.1 SEC-C domain-containing protein [Frankia nepalensis]MBL7519149.1 SEC-C domain-containing protein [Frankia nepalensis]MBL7628125.1 SEC-C domain-containing protein [Frankia nepalensis]